MRVCPSSCTSIVLNRPNSAAILITGLSQVMPVASMPTASGSATLSCWYGTMPMQHHRDEHVDHRADRQRAEDADRHVARRVARFLRRGRHGVEADVGEEHHAGAAQHAAPAELAELTGVRRDERRQVRALHVRRAGDDEDHEHDRLDRHQQRVGVGRLLDADHQQCRDDEDDQRRRQVEEARRAAAPPATTGMTMPRSRARLTK